MVLLVSRIAPLAAGVGVGWLVPRLGTRRAAVLFGLANAASIATLPLGRGLLLAIPVTLLAATDAVADAGMNLQGTAWEAASRRAVLNRLHGGWGLGLLVGSAVAAVAADRGVSLTAHMTGAAVVLAGVIAVAARWLREADPPTVAMAADVGVGVGVGVGEGGGLGVGGGGVGGGEGGGRGARQLLLTLGALGVATAAGEVLVNEWAPLAFTDDLGSTAATAGAAITVFAVGLVAVRAVSDQLTRRFGAAAVWTASVWTGVVGVVGFAVSSGVATRYAALVVMAVGLAGLFPAAYRAGATTPGVAPASGVAAMTTGARIGAMAATLGMGALAPHVPIATAYAILVIPALLTVAALARKLPPPQA